MNRGTSPPFHLVLAVLSALILPACTTYYQGPRSDHFDGTRFHNPGSKARKGGLGAFLRWQLTRRKGPFPGFTPLAVCDTPPERVEGDQLRVSMVGHVSLLLQTRGLNILTDPLWSERASPFSWTGPKRVRPPGIRFDQLPPIDVILISHNHFDHLDLATVERLWLRDRPRILVPLGNAPIIRAHNRAIEVESYDWGDRVTVSETVAIHLEPMHHWSARGLFDRDKALWAAFVVEAPGGNIYFAGDTGYGEGHCFRQAQRKFGRFRLALLPIGSYEPRWFMAYGHMNPREAVEALKELHLPYLVPIHFGVFQLADTGFAQPLEDLEKALALAPAARSKVKVLAPGEHWLVPAAEPAPVGSVRCQAGQ